MYCGVVYCGCNVLIVSRLLWRRLLWHPLLRRGSFTAVPQHAIQSELCRNLSPFIPSHVFCVTHSVNVNSKARNHLLRYTRPLTK